MMVLKSNGEVVVDVVGNTPINRVFFSPDGYAILTADAQLTLYRRDGSIIGLREGMDDVRSVLIGKDQIYMMTEYTLIHYSVNSEQGDIFESHYPLQKLLWYSENELLLCSRSTAKFIQTKS
jgi:hypothetical protein